MWPRTWGERANGEGKEERRKREKEKGEKGRKERRGRHKGNLSNGGVGRGEPSPRSCS